MAQWDLEPNLKTITDAVEGYSVFSDWRSSAHTGASQAKRQKGGGGAGSPSGCEQDHFRMQKHSFFKEKDAEQTKNRGLLSTFTFLLMVGQKADLCGYFKGGSTFKLKLQS